MPHAKVAGKVTCYDLRSEEALMLSLSTRKSHEETLAQYTSAIGSDKQRTFSLGYKLSSHFVRVFAKTDAEIDLRVRFSERIVVLSANVWMITIENVYARGPGDGYCNVQAKNEHLHLVIREHTARVYARFLCRSKKRRDYRYIKCVERRFLSISATASSHKTSLSLSRCSARAIVH